MSGKIKTKKRQAKKRSISKTNGQSRNGKGRGQLVKRGRSQTEKVDWSQWKQYLSQRKRPKPIWKLFDSPKQAALLWSITNDVEESPLLERIENCYEAQTSRNKIDESFVHLFEILSQIDAPTISEDEALLLVAIASLMPELAGVSSEKQWYAALNELVNIVERCSLSDADPWTIQLVKIELPLTLAYLFQQVAKCEALGNVAVAAFNQQLDKLLDGDGWIHSRHLGICRPILAAWTRCWYLIKNLESASLDRDAQIQWEWFLRQNLRLLRGDGSQMIGGPVADRWCQPFFTAAIKTSTDPEDRKLARLVLATGSEKPKTTTYDRGTYSEWAGAGVLQNRWSRKSAKIGLAVDANRMRVEVCRGIPLLTVDQLAEVSINGRTLCSEENWDETCTHFDRDVDYLEFEIELEEDYRLQRQILLAREDEFLLWSDVLLGPDTQRMDYRLQFDFADEISVLPETETTEVYLQKTKIHSLVLPLGLPEWKSVKIDDRLTGGNDYLELNRSAFGNNLYAALFFDLNPNRSKKPRTWRSLTVAERLEIVPPDAAVAYRVQIGKQQWVIYRSLADTGNRSFLGQNHSCEFFVGRFARDGNTEELLSIE